MRKTVPAQLELGRVLRGPYATMPEHGLMGAFVVMGGKGAKLKIVSSGHDTEFGWEHVSVSVEHRPPNWTEMCLVKDLFWGEEECVVQYHPPKSEYVNCHPYCLHLWKPIGVTMPAPPSHLVGIKTDGGMS